MLRAGETSAAYSGQRRFQDGGGTGAGLWKDVERGAAGKLLCQVGAGGFHSEDQSLYLQCLAHLVSLLLLGILE